MALIEAFQHYIDENNLATHDDRILLTVSGGVDSMVMLSLFVRCGYTVGVAHCNFQLRGAESDEDEVLVQKEAAKYGVPCYNRRFETAAEMERTGESMEMAARRLRYAWFDELSRQEGYTVVAIAHHADDSIETFFINLLRGTGLRGLTGISTQVGKVIRPLLFASRREILEYAAANHIPYREDSSNRSTKYLRNKIRLGLIPRIREINPKFTSLMCRNLARLTDAQLFINHGIERIRALAVTSDAGIDTIHLDRIDPAFPREFVIYELLNSAYGFKGDVIDSLCHALEQGATGRRFYARDHVATIDRGRILVSPIAPEDPCLVSVPKGTQRSYCGNAVLYFEYCDIDTIKNFGVPEQIAQLDADRLQFPLTLRRWKEGDWFIPFGMSGRKKVSDFLIDAKVSLPEKQRQFVLLSGDDIVWLVGRRIDDRYRLTSTTENVLRITKEIV
ncbi:tRNA lysidine(34) synthetase TilS [Alistipes sp. An116]|uniref:tRNA lysidine(34) synthetase TilS n=1 Tax=unclassified Alistipes TaxID=2608932 RepID=UPI000B3974F6|nr:MULTISPECIES: tRNA lysidine(34) synthetase TilS [unclassified Alistipes]OUN76990.1 tRNA lysidine(34) synthetase TilS [Alistipes sp. An54]OUQ53240.1 tRNA lysidine(34) synthetase TilS [Alistipes sp. An116]